jgi:hypothetical protein
LVVLTEDEDGGGAGAGGAGGADVSTGTTGATSDTESNFTLITCALMAWSSESVSNEALALIVGVMGLTFFSLLAGISCEFTTGLAGWKASLGACGM